MKKAGRSDFLYASTTRVPHVYTAPTPPIFFHNSGPRGDFFEIPGFPIFRCCGQPGALWEAGFGEILDILENAEPEK